MSGRMLWLALVLAAGSVCAAEPLGRLFYTPAERAQLDVLRTQKNVPPPTPEPQEPVAVPEVITYGGIVRRSDGRTTVWINNQAVHDGKTGEALAIPSRPRPDNSVRLTLPRAGEIIDLKVGQSADIASGAIVEPYSGRHGLAPHRPRPPVPVGDKRATSAAETAAAPNDGHAGRDHRR